MSQIDMAGQLARIAKFPDLAHAGKAIGRAEAIGIARFEQVVGKVAQPATHAGHDFVAPGIWKQVSLKGPILTEAGKQVPITQTRINQLLMQVKAPNTAADSIVVDLMGFSKQQARSFKSEVEALGLSKPVLLIDP